MIMNASFSNMCRLAWYIALLGLTPLLSAQPKNLVPSFRAKQQALLESLPLFVAENWGDAEALLHQANTNNNGTPEWNFEAGGNLVEVASALDNQNQGALAAKVARLALVHFSKAEAGYGASANPIAVAHVRERLGYVYEHYLGDRKSAEAYYASAVALSPTTGFAAQRLAFLQQVDAQEAIKLKARAGR
jgi:hypothetical protein